MKQLALNSPSYAYSALLLLCLLFCFAGCENGKDAEPQSAYLGGEIVNPITEHILIKHDGIILDTITLNEKNRFAYKLDSVQNGLYVIQHRPESQNIHISPGDSLLLRANTLAFDESLHFSGKGNAKNNFLTEMFLEDKNTSELLLNFHEYNPSRFQQIADSIKLERENLLYRANEKHAFSEDFLILARDIINYENRDLKERYTYLVQKYFKEYARQLPGNFHDYRKEIDFNSEVLQSSPGYRRFIINYLSNYSLSWCASSRLDSEDCYNLANVENVKARLNKAGELLEIPYLRQNILKKIAVRGIVMAKSREDIISILKVLEENGFPEKHMDEMKQLGTVQLAFLPGISLNGVPVVNMEGELLRFDSIIKKPTVIFLWSVYKKGHIEEHRRIRQLREKFPEIDFIGINLDLEEEPSWRVAVRKYNYNPQYSYQLGPTRIEKEFFAYYIDKFLFINASGEVVKGDIYLNSPEIETHLLEFLNH